MSSNLLKDVGIKVVHLKSKFLTMQKQSKFLPCNLTSVIAFCVKIMSHEKNYHDINVCQIFAV